MESRPSYAELLVLLKLWGLTALTLLAFAANSLLCRLALTQDQDTGQHLIDPESFTAIRLIAGGAVLIVIVTWQKLIAMKQEERSKLNQLQQTLSPKSPFQTEQHHEKGTGSWVSALALFVYAACFSYAYIYLDAGFGALVLFACVQLTMMCYAKFTGEQFSTRQWLGFVLALISFIGLLLPDLVSSQSLEFSLKGVLLMALAGLAWGIYSIRGKSVVSPLYDTAYNFNRSLIFVALLIVFAVYPRDWTWLGVLLAVLSGGLASGIGYTLWYKILPQLKISTASVIQLSVPVIASILGIFMLNEDISLYLMVVGSLLLLGIGLAIYKKPDSFLHDVNKY